MNRFLKNNSPWLGLLGLAISIVILAFIFRPKAPEYQISANQTLKLISDQSLQVEIQALDGKQIIDIRPVELFAQGHPKNAINIPIRQLLEKESIELFDRLLENKKEAVLYGSNELQATAPFLLLQQLGYKNVEYLHGEMSEKGEFKAPEPASTEVSILDTAAMRARPEIKKAVEKTVVKKKPETLIPVRQEVSSGGGC